MKKLGFLLVTVLVLTLLAGCKIDLPDGPFSVVYFDNGSTSGYPHIDRNEYRSGEEATVLDKNTLIKTGYEFQNWNTDKDGKGESYSAGDKITIGHSTVFLYAIWKEIPQE